MAFQDQLKETGHIDQGPVGQYCRTFCFNLFTRMVLDKPVSQPCFVGRVLLRKCLGLSSAASGLLSQVEAAAESGVEISECMVSR